jgi:hypothetical protein
MDLFAFRGEHNARACSSTGDGADGGGLSISGNRTDDCSEITQNWRLFFTLRV